MHNLRIVGEYNRFGKMLKELAKHYIVYIPTGEFYLVSETYNLGLLYTDILCTAAHVSKMWLFSLKNNFWNHIHEKNPGHIIVLKLFYW